MTSYVPPKKNFASGYTFYVSLAPRTADGTWQANPTLASGDVKIAIDDGAPANLGTLPVVDADFTKRVKVVLSQAETNGDNLSIIFSDAAGAEWCDLTVNLQTAAQTLDDLDGIVDSILTDTAEIGAAGAGLTEAGGTGDHLTALATQTSVDDLPTNAELATALTPIALEATLTTIAGYVDAEVAAILADTNELQTDWANGGRLDLILDARASQTSVDDLPTNAELATALGTADDAVLAAIAALNNISTSDILSAAFEGAETIQDFLRLSRAALYGEVSGAATTTMTFRDAADTKDRITATVDADGNRTALTLDAT